MSKTGYAEEPLQLKKVKIVNNHEKEPPRKENVSLREKLWNFVTVSGKNPDTIKFFNSELKIEAEKQRHWDNFRYAIHPLSKFNEYYKVFCFFFYTLQLVMKAFDYGFVRVSIEGPFLTHGQFLKFGILLDIASILNLFLQLFIGYIHKLRIELKISKIIFKIIISCHLFCDLFSSIPRVLLWNSKMTNFIIVHALTLLKLRRLGTIISLIKPVCRFFNITCPVKIFTMAFFYMAFLLMHFMSCLHMGLTRYRSSITGDGPKNSLGSRALISDSLSDQYMIVFFRNAQFALLLDVNQEFYRIEIVEEQLFNLIKYVTGKALVISVWMVTLAIFMSTMTLDIKFEEIITELKEYMVSKQLPEELKIRMVSYYKFKYHKAYVNEKYIRSIFSTNLKREMDVFLYKSLINQVSIFSHISPKNMQLITANLVPEIYLPSDLIIQSGTHGDCMYFIESGTVAVFTPSGKEICHLHDGDYFGEVSLLSVSKKRTASVVAIEATRIYKLRNKVFHTCFKKTEQAYQLIREMAKKRILQTDDLERLFKKDKLEQQYLENFRE